MQIGFESYADAFAKHMVDGDLLLLLTEKELEQDLQMSSALLRKRFIRELESLKVSFSLGNPHLIHSFRFICLENLDRKMEQKQLSW